MSMSITATPSEAMTANDKWDPAALNLTSSNGSVPGLVWKPAGDCYGVVLACHGGSGHKLSGAIQSIVGELVPRGMVVVAIDGPVHGGRRADGNLDPTVARQAFRDAWRAGIGKLTMAEEMGAALDAVMDTGDLADLPIGYIGVSMGTAYGLPLLANRKDIKAAAIGLWGVTYPASEHLADFAKDVSCSVWFTQQWNDEFFDREGTFALFDAIGSQDKRLVAYPGPHRELEGDRLKDAVDFLVARLAPSH
jgi:dienelactone hydrolase